MHYFCEGCALKQFSKSTKCFVCGANTNGVFNNANDLKVRLEKRKTIIQEKQEEIRKRNESINESVESGDESGDEED